MHQDNRAGLRKTFAAAGLATLVIVTLVTAAPAQPPQQAEKDVVVVNPATQPVPVTGNVAVNGTVEIAGTTAVTGTMQSTQSGLWTVGIDPARNRVSLADGPTFYHDSNLGIINNGETKELGPFEVGAVRQLRFIARAVNGDVTFRVMANVLSNQAQIDRFTVGGESGNLYKTVVYYVPPPSVSIIMTEAGAGGSNFQIVLIGR